MKKAKEEVIIEEVNYKEKYEEEKKKNKRLIVIFIIVIIFLIFLFYFIGQRFSKIGYSETYAPINGQYGVKEKTIKITQNNIDFDEIEDLDIFCNTRFNNKKIIAPQSYGTYTFLVENLLRDRISYSIRMEEKNEYNVNMKYKLKIDNIYIVGSKDKWADVEDLKVEDIIVTENSKNRYTLEWYWEDAQNDTEIAKQLYASYELNIKIYDIKQND